MVLGLSRCKVYPRQLCCYFPIRGGNHIIIIEHSQSSEMGTKHEIDNPLGVSGAGTYEGKNQLQAAMAQWSKLYSEGGTVFLLSDARSSASDTCDSS